MIDEPFTGIEPIIIDKMTALLIEQKNAGKGILITDHYYRYTSKISDVAYMMKEGNCKELESEMELQPQLIEKGYLNNS